MYIANIACAILADFTQGAVLSVNGIGGKTMPMQRELYPPDWEEIAFTKKESAGWKCEVCGKQCRKPGEPFDTHKNTLTVSHQDHNPANCSDENLRAMCAPCHLRYDARHHAETRARRVNNEN